MASSFQLLHHRMERLAQMEALCGQHMENLLTKLTKLYTGSEYKFISSERYQGKKLWVCRIVNWEIDSPRDLNLGPLDWESVVVTTHPSQLLFKAVSPHCKHSSHILEMYSADGFGHQRNTRKVLYLNAFPLKRLWNKKSKHNSDFLSF